MLTVAHAKTATATKSGTHTNSGTPTRTATSSPTSQSTATVTATATATVTPTGSPFYVVDRNVARAGDRVGVHFWLTDGGNGVLAVYNSAGEKIKTLWNAPLDARRWYDVFWNVENDAGDPVSSNVYVLRFRSGTTAYEHKIAITR